MENSQELNKIWQKAEEKRMELVKQIKAKQDHAVSNFDGMEQPPMSFVDEYNNLVDEHNQSMLAQKSIKENMGEYHQMTGDDSFKPQYMSANGLFSRLGKYIKKEGTQLGKFVKKEGDIVGQKLKTGLLAVPRSAALLLIKLNLWGIGSSIYAWKISKDKTINKKYEAVRNEWFKLGGDRNIFDKNVNQGGKKKPLRFLFKNNAIKGADGSLNVAGVDDVAEIGTMVASASGVLTTLVKSFNSQGGKIDTPAGNELPKITEEQQKQIDTMKAAVESGELNPDKEAQTKRYIAIGIASAVIIAGIITTVILINKNKSK